MRGPIDYIVVAFQDGNFTGEILEELAKASDAGTIAVLDVAVVGRDSEGVVSALEISDGSLVELIQGLGLEGGLITSEDIEEVGDLLEDGTSAGLLIVEQLWAKGLKQAIANAGGTLIDEGRIHPEASKELEGGAQ